MSLKSIQKRGDFNASAEKVWQVLLSENYIKQWYTAFGDNVAAKTDWKLGSKAVFTDGNGDGLVGHIVKHEPFKEIAIEYDGHMIKGQEDLTSEAAVATKGTIENYILEPVNNGTALIVNCEMDENYHEMMSAMWDKALEKIKQLCEN